MAAQGTHRPEPDKMACSTGGHGLPRAAQQRINGKDICFMKIGMWELILVVVVAFIFIGPDQLPVYARKFGKMLRDLRKYTGAASEEIQKNVVEPQIGRAHV